MSIRQVGAKDADNDDDTYCKTINKTERKKKRIWNKKHKLYLFKVRVLKATRY